MENAVHGGLQDHQVAHVHGNQEIEVVNGSSDDIVAGVAVGGERAGQVNPVHQAAAQQGVERVGIVGQNNFRHLRLRVLYRPGSQLQVCAHDGMVGSDRKSTRLNSSHMSISYAVFCLK